MRLEHWMQLLFGTVIVGTLGFFGFHIFDMKGILSRVDTKVEAVETKVDLTDRRLTRIADVLPDLKARVAWEEINNGITGFVVSTKPKKTNKNAWKTYIKIYNLKKNKLHVYPISQDENHKDVPAYIVAGKIRESGGCDPSFRELEQHCAELKEPSNIPASYNTETSFLVRKTDIEKFESHIASFTKQKPWTIKTTKMRNWKEIMSNLEEIEEKLEVVIAEARKSNKVSWNSYH